LDREEGKNKTRREAGHGRRVVNIAEGSQLREVEPLFFGAEESEKPRIRGSSRLRGGERTKGRTRERKIRERRDKGEERRGLFAVGEPGIEKTRTEGSLKTGSREAI